MANLTRPETGDDALPDIVEALASELDRVRRRR